MLLTFFLFQSNLYIVLAHGKGPKNSIHRDLFKTKTSKQKTPRLQAAFYVPYLQCVDRPKTSSSQNVLLIPWYCVCEKHFKIKFNYTRHMKIHLEEKEEFNCRKTYTRKIFFDTHLAKCKNTRRTARLKSQNHDSSKNVSLVNTSTDIHDIAVTALN